MILNKKALTLRQYLYLERYINDGSPSGFSEIKTSSQATTAKGKNESFYLSSLQFLQNAKIYEYGEKPAFADKWEMLAHPDMVYNSGNNNILANCKKINLQSIRVSPTSSIRTVKTLDNDGWFIKLHYDGLIGRVNRKIEKKHAISAIEVSKTIQNAIEKGFLTDKFFIQKEVFARVVEIEKSFPYQWGVVLREPTAYPYNEKVKFLIPAFSLFSVDPNNKNHESILTQLIKKQSKKVDDFLFEDVISPIFENYFKLLIYCGLQLECHAQNTLFAIDEDFKVLGIVVRDMESIDKDISLMQDLNIENNFTETKYKFISRVAGDNYFKQHSFMFDFKLGEYLISPIIENAEKNFPLLDKTSLINRLKEHNQFYIKQLPKDFFLNNNKWYSDQKEIRDRTKKKHYLENENPKFR